MLGLLNSRPHSRRSEFYHQLAQSINAGLTVPQALKVLQSSGLAGPYQACLTQWLQHLERGLTLEEAISVHPVGHFPSLDRSLMGAGERSGRLDTCLLSLSRYHQLNAANIRAMAQALAWPLLTLHAFFFLGPLPKLVLSGGLIDYLVQVLWGLGPLYLVFFLLSRVFASSRSGQWSLWIERMVYRIPLLGGGLRAMSLSRFTLALESLLGAGVSASQAWTEAAAASGSPQLVDEIRTFPAAIEQGKTPSEWMSDSRVFPDLFKLSYHSGEVSGKLDENIQRLNNVYEQEGVRKLQSFAAWFPRTIYLGIVILCAYRIVSFYAGYFGGLGL